MRQGEADGGRPGSESVGRESLHAGRTRVFASCSIFRDAGYFVLYWVARGHSAARLHSGLIGIVSLWLSVPTLFGQGTLDYQFLQTGGGESLVSAQQVLQINGLNSPAVMFEFGFLTSEVVAPDVFLDSFTVTLQDAMLNTVVIVTADGSGVVWAPPSGGGVVVADSDVQRIIIPPPSLQPVGGQGVAFSVSLPLPPQFTGSAVTVFFDLFDNLDDAMSIGWYHDPHISAVPEPSMAGVLILGLLAMGVRRRHAS